jgi:hypothetical protein
MLTHSSLVARSPAQTMLLRLRQSLSQFIATSLFPQEIVITLPAYVQSDRVDFRVQRDFAGIRIGGRSVIQVKEASARPGHGTGNVSLAV